MSLETAQKVKASVLDSEGHRLSMILDEQNDLHLWAGAAFSNVQVRFCGPGGGGRHSPRLRAALLELLEAMREEPS